MTAKTVGILQRVFIIVAPVMLVFEQPTLWRVAFGVLIQAAVLVERFKRD